MKSHETNPWNNGLKRLFEQEIEIYFTGEENLTVGDTEWQVTDGGFSEDGQMLALEFNGEFVVVFRAFLHWDRLDISAWRNRSFLESLSLTPFFPGDGIGEDSEHVLELQLVPANRNGLGEQRRLRLSLKIRRQTFDAEYEFNKRLSVRLPFERNIPNHTSRSTGQMGFR